MSRPLVADTLARLVTAFVNPTPKPAVRFVEIAGRINEVTIQTRHGPTAATIYDVLQWASAPQRDWDGSRLCVGGQSAGGNLSAAVSRMTMTHGGPAITLQMLHYPVLDLVTPTAEKKSTHGAKAVVKPWMDYVFNAAYVPERTRRRDPLVSPALGENADDVAGIAPAVVISAEHDRLRDEGKRYADKLEEAGSLAEYYEVRSVDHGYNIMTDARDITRQVYGRIAGHVHRAIGET